MCYWSHCALSGRGKKKKVRHPTVAVRLSWPSLAPVSLTVLYSLSCSVVLWSGCRWLPCFLGTSCAQCVPLTVLYSCDRDLWQTNLICSDHELAVVLPEGPNLLLLIYRAHRTVCSEPQLYLKYHSVMSKCQRGKKKKDKLPIGLDSLKDQGWQHNSSTDRVLQRWGSSTQGAELTSL